MPRRERRWRPSTPSAGSAGRTTSPRPPSISRRMTPRGRPARSSRSTAESWRSRRSPGRKSAIHGSRGSKHCAAGDGAALRHAHPRAPRGAHREHAPAARYAERAGHVRAGVRRAHRDVFRRQTRHRCAGGGGAGLPPAVLVPEDATGGRGGGVFSPRRPGPRARGWRGPRAALIPLSPCLIFGWGPFPRLGVAGGAVAVIAYYVVGSIALVAYLRAAGSVVRLSFADVRFRWPLFRDILRVGAVAALITIQTNLTIAIATGFVGRFGPAAIAGYGTGSRVEYLLIPLVFGLGGPLVAMVGTNIGAGRRDRALRAAWIGAGIATGLTEIIGLCAAAVPHAWLSLFDTDPAMLDAGSRYLRAVGPFYGLFGLGLALTFASQGAGRLLWPLVGNMTRLLISPSGSWLAPLWSGDVSYVFVALSAALAAYGLMNAGAVARGAWFGPIAWPRARVLVREGNQWR